MLRFYSLLALFVPHVLSAQDHTDVFRVVVRGQLLAIVDSDTLPAASSEVRLPAFKVRTQTDANGRFNLHFSSPAGCFVLYADWLQYRLTIDSSGLIDLGSIQLPHRSRFFPDLGSPKILGSCDPGQVQYDYDWIVAGADLAGYLRYSSGEPIGGQPLVVRCMGILPEPDIPPARRTHPIVFVADERPVTDSSGHYLARLRVRLDRLAWVTSLDSVPCHVIVWREPFDSVRVRLRFVPSEWSPFVSRADITVPPRIPR
jgi:hypothetical protein